MRYDEIDDKIKNQLHENFDAKEIVIEGVRYLSLDGMIPIQIYPVQKYTTKKDIYEIPIIYDSREVGCLCLMSQIPNQLGTNTLTQNQYIAYIEHIDKITFLSNMLIKFPCDYIVINENFLDTYLTFKDTSPIWGGFTHKPHHQKDYLQDASDTKILITIDVAQEQLATKNAWIWLHKPHIRANVFCIYTTT